MLLYTYEGRLHKVITHLLSALWSRVELCQPLPGTFDDQLSPLLYISH